ncbi:uncharacterized protein PG986_014402 [Apiospora aurea]|uniref:AA1-like domain-containing protein n=1 Tax=Apiospora aurea TaxID=335848 RepID=A0ABR1PSW0_9PEZI
MQHATAVLTTLSAAALPMRSGTNAIGCQAATLGNYSWEIRNFYHQVLNTRGHLSFDLSNPVLLHASQCSASDSQPFSGFYGTIPYKCADGTEGTTTQTTFDFNSLSRTLNINQTVRFHAYGSINLTLDCTDKVTNDWKMDKLGSSRETKCTSVAVLFRPYQMTAVA